MLQHVIEQEVHASVLKRKQNAHDLMYKTRQVLKTFWKVKIKESFACIPAKGQRAWKIGLGEQSVTRVAYLDLKWALETSIVMVEAESQPTTASI